MRFVRFLSRRLAGERGQSIVEALMAVAVLGIAAETTAVLVQTMAKETVANRDRAFATEKALQMLEELREVALTNGEDMATFESTYSDGYCDTCTPAHPWYKWSLTTKYDVNNNTATGQVVAVPDWKAALDPHSSNPIRPNQGYAFCRYVSITPSPTDPNVRTIYVRVYSAASNPGGVSSSQLALPSTPQSPPLAEVYGVVHSAWTTATPSQVLDLYFLALENVPGWWTRTSDLEPLMQQAVVTLQAENPGLVVRSHWIQTLSYGRDLEYSPEINAEANSVTNSASLQKAYVYPGYADFDQANASDYYYEPSLFQGRVDVGGSMPNKTGYPTDDDSNWGYPIADQFNHAMRWPDEQALYNVMTKIASNTGSAAPQPSWRMLLEELNEDSPNLQNAVILNLHGEMVPVPPLRNYSDAAKDPGYFYSASYASEGLLGQRSFRATAQPERLWYPNGVTMGVNVYAWDANPDEITCDYCSQELVNNITLFIPGASVNNLAAVYRTQGNSENPYYRFVTGTAAGCSGCTGFPYNTGSIVSDSTSSSESTATFWADNYTPTGTGGVARSSGLRIQFFGTTPTAREYYGAEFSAIPSP